VLIGIVIASVLLVAALVSVWLVIRDVRSLHRAGKSIADLPGDAAGVTTAGMVWQNNLGSH
jgi:hypothetical protein